MRNRIFIPHRDFFAFVTQSEREAKLGADAVAVRADMADDAKSFVFLDDVENAINDLGMLFHDSLVGPLSVGEGFSNSSRIWRTRLPRTMESSTRNFNVGVYFKTTDLATMA